MTLDDIKKTRAAMTAGPWNYWDSEQTILLNDSTNDRVIDKIAEVDFKNKKDAHFIAKSPEMIDWLVNRLEAAEGLMITLYTEICCYSTGASVLSEDGVKEVLEEIRVFRESLTPKPKDKD